MCPGIVLRYSINTVADIAAYLLTDTTATSPNLQAVALKVCGYVCLQYNLILTGMCEVVFIIFTGSSSNRGRVWSACNASSWNPCQGLKLHSVTSPTKVITYIISTYSP